MMVTTLSGLRTAVLRQLDDDAVTAEDVTTYIQLAYAAIVRELRTHKLIGVTTFEITSERMALPSDFLAISSFHHNDADRTPILPTTSRNRVAHSSACTTGKPRMVTIEGDSFVFSPPPSGTGAYSTSLSYFQRPAMLTVDASMNTALTEYPDLFFNQALAEAYGQLDDDANQSKFQAKAASILASIRRQDLNDRYQGGALRQKVGLIV